MNYAVNVSAQAESDMRDIVKYIACELQAEENAVGQLQRLEKSIMSLGQLPERYPLYRKEPWKNRGLRIMPVDHYLVFYIPDSDKQAVYILPPTLIRTSSCFALPKF